MKRREFMALLGGAASIILPHAARAQQPTVPVVGLLRADTPAAGADVVAAFRKGLSEMGFVEGRNLAIEIRWAQNDRARMPELAADLIHRKVDVIAAPGSAVGALAAKALTTTIPIVFASGGDPVELGLVESLNRPGSNVTGFTDMNSDLTPKQFGLLHELLPEAADFGVLVTRSYPWVDRVAKDARSAAAAMGRQAEIFFAATDREIDAAFAEIGQKHVNAIMVPDDVVLVGRRTQILTLFARHGLPAIYSNRAWADAGGLLSYGPLTNDQSRQAGIYVGRILKGEKPADLPVARATKFEFIINLATAHAINVAVPPTMLARADEVIE
jgi:putative tryptophan/tyrosine transport system substrate-binding protein